MFKVKRLTRSIDGVTEAAVLSNAGGRVNADALRSIYTLDSMAGVGTVVVVHHTGNARRTFHVLSMMGRVIA